MEIGPNLVIAKILPPPKQTLITCVCHLTLIILSITDLSGVPPDTVYIHVPSVTHTSCVKTIIIKVNRSGPRLIFS